MSIKELREIVDNVLSGNTVVINNMDTANELVNKGYLDPEGNIQGANHEDFINTLENHSKCILHASATKHDGVTLRIDELGVTNPTREELIELINTYYDADRIRCDDELFWCWYD